MTVIVDDAPDSPYSLVITADGELEARQSGHTDEAVQYTTGAEPTTDDTQPGMVYDVAVADLLDWYQTTTDSHQSPFELAVKTIHAFTDHDFHESEDSAESAWSEQLDNGVHSSGNADESSLEVNDRQQTLLSDSDTPGTSRSRE